MTPTTRFAGAGVLLVAMIVIAYGPAFPGGFIWDDDSALLDNPLVREPDGLKRIWFSTDTLEYYPLTFTSLRAQWRLFGDRAAGYLSVNVALHALNTLLLLGLLWRLPWPFPLIAAALFAVHPANVFAVAWISQHKTVLSTLFYLASFLFYLRALRRPAGQGHGSLAACFVFFVAGLLSKPTLVLLPAVYALAGHLTGTRRGWKLWAPLAPFFAVALLLGVLRIYWHPPMDHALAPPRIGQGWEQAVLPGLAVLFYISKLLFPTNLMMVYPRWTLDATNPLSYVPTVLLLGLCAAAWRWRRTAPVAALAFFFFLAGLFPVLGFFDNQYFTFSFVANHWVYLPMAGMAVLAAGALTGKSFQSFPAWVRTARGLVLALIPALLLLGARTQASRFRDPVVYYRRGAAENPDNVIAHHNLANLYIEAGKPEQALPHYLEAIRIHPVFWQARNGAAAILIEQGAVPEALEQLTESLRLFEQNPETHLRLGTLYGQLGKVDLAIEHLASAVKINPQDAVAFNNLGIAFHRAGQPDRAAACFRKSLELNPAYEAARSNLARVAPE